MSERKVQGRIPQGVRPHLPSLIRGLEAHPCISTTDAVELLAQAFNVTDSTIWKASKLRGEHE